MSIKQEGGGGGGTTVTQNGENSWFLYQWILYLQLEAYILSLPFLFCFCSRAHPCALPHEYFVVESSLSPGALGEEDIKRLRSHCCIKGTVADDCQAPGLQIRGGHVNKMVLHLWACSFITMQGVGHSLGWSIQSTSLCSYSRRHTRQSTHVSVSAEPALQTPAGLWYQPVGSYTAAAVWDTHHFSQPCPLTLSSACSKIP